jgi:tRNA threonylcarbamoyl adenosine modification protein YjeE
MRSSLESAAGFDTATEDFEVRFPFTSVVSTPEQMGELGYELAQALHAGDLVVLTGALGAGKTTFTRGIGEGLGVRGPVTSPTFVLARTHPSLVGGAPLVHVDAYRLASAVELDDLDIDFVSSVVVVEWGVGMLDGVADSWLEVTIDRARATATDAEAVDASADLESPDPRTVTIVGHGPRWESA